MSMGNFVPPPLNPIGIEPVQLQTDVPCRKCQYNLRGLAMDSRCPECGTPVGFSTQGDLIRYSDPAWTESLRTGIACILWGVVVAIFAAVVNAINGPKSGSPAGLIVSAMSSVLYLIGAWLLTTPDPSGLGEDRYGTSRKLIRITLAAGLFEHLLTFAQQSSNLPPTVTSIMLLIGGIASLFSLVGTFATLNYLGKLAARIPNHELTARAKTLMWGIGLPLAIIVVLGLFVVAVTASSGPRALRDVIIGIGCLFSVCGLALIVFGIMYLLFLEKLRKQLAVNAEIARRTWAAHAPPQA